jgi:hypothetical protein
VIRVTARSPTTLSAGTKIAAGGALTVEGFDDLVGTIVRAEVVEEEGRLFLEVEAEIDESSRAAQVATDATKRGFSLDEGSPS